MKDQELIDSINAMIVAEENKFLANTPSSCLLCLLDAKPTKVETLQLPEEPTGPKPNEAELLTMAKSINTKPTKVETLKLTAEPKQLRTCSPARHTPT